MTDPARRKELKDAYREQAPEAGVYRISHSVTGRSMVATSTNLPGVQNRLKFAISQRSGAALDHRLRADADLHGFDGLQFEILDRLNITQGMTSQQIADDLATLRALLESGE